MINLNKNFKYIKISNPRKEGTWGMGYSIIEIIIYLAIFSAISILVINSFIVILSSFNTTAINRKLLESGEVSIERISREIRRSESVNASTSSDNLMLNSYDDEGEVMVVKFIKEDGSLNLYRDSILEGNLLGENVSITNLVFRRITTSESEAIKIEMTLQYSKGNIIKVENFYNTIVLRGGY